MDGDRPEDVIQRLRVGAAGRAVDRAERVAGRNPQGRLRLRHGVGSGQQAGEVVLAAAVGDGSERDRSAAGHGAGQGDGHASDAALARLAQAVVVAVVIHVAADAHDVRGDAVQHRLGAVVREGDLFVAGGDGRDVEQGLADQRAVVRQLGDHGDRAGLALVQRPGGGPDVVPGQRLTGDAAGRRHGGDEREARRQDIAHHHVDGGGVAAVGVADRERRQIPRMQTAGAGLGHEHIGQPANVGQDRAGVVAVALAPGRETNGGADEGASGGVVVRRGSVSDFTAAVRIPITQGKGKVVGARRADGPLNPTAGRRVVRIERRRRERGRGVVVSDHARWRDERVDEGHVGEAVDIAIGQRHFHVGLGGGLRAGHRPVDLVGQGFGREGCRLIDGHVHLQVGQEDEHVVGGGIVGQGNFRRDGADRGRILYRQGAAGIGAAPVHTDGEGEGRPAGRVVGELPRGEAGAV